MATTKHAAPANSDQWLGFLSAKIIRLIETGRVRAFHLRDLAVLIRDSNTSSKSLQELSDVILEYQK